MGHGINGTTTTDIGLESLKSAMSLEFILENASNRFASLFSGHTLSGLSVDSGLAGALVVAVIFSLLAASMLNLGKKTFPSVFLFTVFLLLYLYLPFKVQVRWVPERTSLYLLIVALFTMSFLIVEKKGKIAALLAPLLVALSVLVMGVNLYVNTRDHFRVNEYMEEYLAGLDLVEENSTILAIRVVSPMPDDVGFSLLHKLLQGGGYYASIRSSLDVKNFQAKTKVVPIVYIKEKNPYRHWIKDPKIISAVPEVNLKNFSNISDDPLDYVLIWGNLAGALEYPKLRTPLVKLIQSLENDFDLVKVSSPNNFMTLYRGKHRSDKGDLSAGFQLNQSEQNVGVTQ